MRTRTVVINDDHTQRTVIPLGRQGENLATEIVFDCAAFVECHGQGTAQLLHQRARDQAPYPCVITQEGGLVKWRVTAPDLAMAGEGWVELRWYVGEVLIKSKVYRASVARGLSDHQAQPPEPEQPWVDQVLEAANDIKTFGGTTQGQIAAAVGNYFTEHPIELPSGGGSGEDLFAVEGDSNAARVYNAFQKGGVFSGGGREMSLEYEAMEPPAEGGVRQYIACRRMGELPAVDVTVRDITFRPEGAYPVLIQLDYTEGTWVFENVTFRNVTFWINRQYQHRFIFRNCRILDNEYNFLYCAGNHQNGEYVIEDCTFRHQRPNLEEYRGDIYSLKLNGWAHGNIRSEGTKLVWNIRRTLFEDGMGRNNLAFARSRTLPDDAPASVKLYMEDCTISRTNGPGIHIQYRPLSGWIKNCKFLNIGANRCTDEGYDLPEDEQVVSGSGTEEDPYLYRCGVGANAIFSVNQGARSELVISGNYIYNCVENGIEGNYHAIMSNHIENTGYRMEEGIWNPSTEGIYGNARIIRGNTILNPYQKAGMIIPHNDGFSDGEACLIEDNIIERTQGENQTAAIEVSVERQRFDYEKMVIARNRVRGFKRKYRIYNRYNTELTNLSIYDVGDDDRLFQGTNMFYQADVHGLAFDGERYLPDIVRDPRFLSWSEEGTLAEWSAQFGTIQVYESPASGERFLRLTGNSYAACSLLAQDYHLGDDVYLACIRFYARSTSGAVAVAPYSVDNTGTIAKAGEDISFNPKMVSLVCRPYEEGFTELVSCMAVTKNCRICMINPFTLVEEGTEEVFPSMDIKDVRITLYRCNQNQSVELGDAVAVQNPAALVPYDFSGMQNKFLPATAAMVDIYLPGEKQARKVSINEAAWYMGAYTSPSLGRGRIVLNSDIGLYESLVFYRPCLCDLELNGHKIYTKAGDSSVLTLYREADVTLRGRGTVEGVDYAVTIYPGSRLTVEEGVTAATAEGTFAVLLGERREEQQAELVIHGGTIGPVFGLSGSLITFDLSEGKTAAVESIHAKGGIAIGENTQVRKGGTAISTTKLAIGLLEAADVTASYSAGYLASGGLVLTGDESSVEWRYTDLNGLVYSGTGTLGEAIVKARSVVDAQDGRFAITLEKDVEAYAAYAVISPCRIILNLNGYKVLNQYDSYAFALQNGADVIITDGSAEGEGTIESTTYQAVVVDHSTLTLDAGRIVCAPNDGITIRNGGALTITGSGVVEGGNGVVMAGVTSGSVGGSSLRMLGGSITARKIAVRGWANSEGITAQNRLIVSGGHITANAAAAVYGIRSILFEGMAGKQAVITSKIEENTNPVEIAENTLVTVDGTAVTSLQNAKGVITVSYQEGLAGNAGG